MHAITCLFPPCYVGAGVRNPTARRIEFIGDSLTAGFGTEGVSGRCTNLRLVHNVFQTYGSQAVGMLGERSMCSVRVVHATTLAKAKHTLT